MKTEIAGITRANEGIQGISWNILGQTYVPKNVTEHSFSWHATFPPETFVPPHIHPDQDEYSTSWRASSTSSIDGAETQATPAIWCGCRWASCTASSTSRGRTAKTLFWSSRECGGSTICYGDPQHEENAGRGARGDEMPIRRDARPAR